MRKLNSSVYGKRQASNRRPTSRPDPRLVAAMEPIESRTLMAATNPAVIDTYIGYTAAALANVGGSQQLMQEKISRSIATLNQAMADSKVRTSIRLVGTMQTSYVEAGPNDDEADLASLTNLADGKADDLTNAANAAGADSIQMITKNFGGGITQGKYNVEGVYYVNAGIINHEFGHSLGGHHPHGAGEDGNHADPRAYEGTVTFGDKSFTGAIGGAMNWYSNPDVLWRGKPTGVAGTGADAANNAAVMNANAPAFSANSAPMVADNAGPVVALGSVQSIGGQNAITFKVRFFDGSGVDVDTMANGNVVVTGPNGFSAPANLVSVDDPSVNYAYHVATYTVATPGPVGDLGQYAFALQANGVKDTAGNAAAAGPVGANYTLMPEYAGSDFESAADEGDLAGRSWLNTDEIGPKWKVNGFVDWNYYRFSLSTASRLSITLPDKSTANGTLRYSLYRDTNGNQTQDTGETIAPDAPNTWTNLPAGENYYFFINPWQAGNIPYGAYTVKATATPFGAPIPPAAPSTLAGAVFTDANANALRDAGEAGVPNIPIALTGTDIAGLAVNLTANTDANGVFSFTGLQPSNAAGYTMTERVPAGIPAINVTPGTLGGTNSGDFTRTIVKSINVIAGAAGTGYLFGTAAAIPTSPISGSVYFDTNDNGARDAGEAGIPNVTLTLGSGNILGRGGLPARTVTTDANGNFIFNDVPASDTNGYFLTETQPASVLDGKDTVGSIGGIANAPKNAIRGVVFTGQPGTGYLFGEKPLTANPPAPPTPPTNPTVTTPQNTTTGGNVVNGTTVASLQVNAGGTAFGSFGAEQFSTPGTNFSVTRAVQTAGVANAADASIYQTLKYGTDFSYSLPATQGTTYTVRLHFAETGYGIGGQRSFNVDINGNRALSNFDVFATAGGADRAVVREFTATADANGKIVVRLAGAAGSIDQNAIINALELIPTTQPVIAPSLQLNAGGAVNGPYAGDQYYSANTNVNVVGATIDTAGVANAAPAAIYQSQRYGNSFDYKLPTKPGLTYTVRMHFAETFRTAPGRVFNVSLDFNEVLSNFDVFTAAGAANKAVVRDFNYVADGSGYLQVDFQGVAGSADTNAIINGFELIPTTPARTANRAAPLVAQLLTAPQHASNFQLNADGSYVYNPSRDFSGADSFVYQVVDANGRVASSTVNITVDPVHQAPEYDDETEAEFFISQTDTLDVDLNTLVLSPDNLPLTFTLGSVTGGTAVMLADHHSVRFTPTRTFDGEAVINFSVSDSQVTVNTKFVVDVGAVQQDPIAGQDTISVDQSETVEIDVLNNDLNPQGVELYLKNVTKPAHGTAFIDTNGTPQTSDDLIVYRPEFGFIGTDMFTYEVEDFYGSSAIGTISAVVGQGAQPTPQNLFKTFEFETRQAAIFNFNSDVTPFLERSDFHIVNANSGAIVPSTAGTLSFNANGTQARLVLTNALANGNYTLTLGASQITLNFFVLAGDANRDRVVDFADLVVLAQNYGTAGKTLSQGNFNYDTGGNVDFSDLVILAQNYSVSLPSSRPAFAAGTRFGKEGIRRPSVLSDDLERLGRGKKLFLS
jgi:hypothetical protein